MASDSIQLTGSLDDIRFLPDAAIAVARPRQYAASAMENLLLQHSGCKAQAKAVRKAFLGRV
jgi:hypothetical protein